MKQMDDSANRRDQRCGRIPKVALRQEDSEGKRPVTMNPGSNGRAGDRIMGQEGMLSEMPHALRPNVRMGKVAGTPQLLASNARPNPRNRETR